MQARGQLVLAQQPGHLTLNPRLPAQSVVPGGTFRVPYPSPPVLRTSLAGGEAGGAAPASVAG